MSSQLLEGELILGVFDNEFALRDYIADNLNKLEAGLICLKKEYQLSSKAGAGGRIDILAVDSLDHVVAVEVKKSDSSARETLHELAKYISLLMVRDRVPREIIRCIVVSTEWHELLIPFSYFYATSGVHILGVEPVNENGEIIFREKAPIPLPNLPQFAPEISLYKYNKASDRDQHLKHIQSKIEPLPFVRMAFLSLDLNPNEKDNWNYRSIVCIWRINDIYYSEIQRICGFEIGHLMPYGFPGWEAECDVMYWAADDGTDFSVFTSAEEERGTPEKIKTLLVRFSVSEVCRLGDWPSIEIINNDKRIIAHLEAVTSLVSVERKNRYLHNAILNPKIHSSWQLGVQQYLDFISFVPYWRDAAKQFLENCAEMEDVRVKLNAFDKKHFFYAVHQGLKHPDASLSTIDIQVTDASGELVNGLFGFWVWDGKTCPGNPHKAIEEVYGNLAWASISLFSAVDTKRYELAYEMHGFHPFVAVFEPDESKKLIARVYTASPREDILLDTNYLHEFVSANHIYSEQVSKILCRFGDIPTNPGDSGPVFLAINPKI